MGRKGERDGRTDDDIMETGMRPSCLNRVAGKAQRQGLRTGGWGGAKISGRKYGSDGRGSVNTL